MDSKRRNEIWESKNKNKSLKEILEEMVEQLIDESKSNRKSYIDEKLRDLFGEKELLGESF